MPKARDKNAILEISTVVGCRMSCSYCPQKTHIKRYASFDYSATLSLEDYRACLAKVPKYVSICFAGMAEPFLNSNCVQMILDAHQAGHEISVFTTGYGLKCNDLEKIQHIPYRHFCVHLPDAEGLMRLKVTEDYLETVLQVRSRLPNATFMCIGKLHPEVEELLGAIKDGRDSLISRASNLDHIKVEFKHGPLKCSGGEDLNHNILLPNGSVVLCCMDYAIEHVIGNLRTDTYESLFNSEEFLRIERGMAGDESVPIACRRCEVAVPV
jgi:sulfatase maturation enzyme AslB (radical SAM superfamily)